VYNALKSYISIHAPARILGGVVRASRSVQQVSGRFCLPLFAQEPLVAVSRFLHLACILLAGTLLFAAPLCAQLQLGNLSLSANGTLSTSYNADYGNLISSSHSIGVGGAGTVSGYYFNPNFLSFTATPYYNSARDSSAYRSISNSSGFDTSATIFGGSSFPGSVNYSRAFDSQGTFNVPGLANFTTHGNSQSFGINWAARLKGLPSLAVGFQKSGSQNTIYGVSQQSSSSSHNFDLNSSYQWHGFGLGGAYYMGSSNSEFPEILSGSTQLETSHTADHGYSFNVSHALPWNGSSFFTYNSSSAHSDFLNTHTDYTVDTLVSGASFHPGHRLSMSTSMDYSNNLGGSLEQQIIAAGGVVIPSTEVTSAAHSWDFAGTVGYLPMEHMQLQGSAERRVQSFVGKTFGSNLYDGQVNYTHSLAGGHISSALSVEDSTVDNSPVNTLGFTATTVYGREMGAWHFNGSINYSQGVQTLLVTYTESQYSYGGSVRRKFSNGIIWTGSYGAGRTGLTGVSGTTSKSDSVSTGLSLGRWASLGANYSKSSGNGIVTGTGLIVTPVPSPLLPATSVVLYGGRSYSASIGSSPIHRLTLSASYGRSDTTTGGFAGVPASSNITKFFNSLVQYQFRKMYFTGGFSRLTQGFSASGLPPETVSAYYISISRWFNFF
jgi:hypothetical protein